MMVDRIGGRQTNFGGAWYISQLQAKHDEWMKNDPEYAAMFNKHPETWFFAQMMLPITPFDFGVSLSKAGRVVGGLAGAWAMPDYAKDPIGFAAALAAIGPVFTYNMLGRMEGEWFPSASSTFAPKTPNRIITGA